MIAVLGALVLVGCGPVELAPPPVVVPPGWDALPEPERWVAADQACGRGAVDACWALGLQRRWQEDDAAGARVAWSAGCDAGDPRCCGALPTTEVRPADPDPDAVNAALWARCDADDAWGCLTLAHRLGRSLGANPSPKDLAWIRNQVCDLQLDYGCAPHADWPQ